MSEHGEQVAVFEWASTRCARYPALELLHAVPNGGWRAKHTAAMLKAEGVKEGVPDLDLPVARHGYHGLRIELKLPKYKRHKDGGLSPAQQAWGQRLQEEGYRWVAAYGSEEAIRELEDYLDMAQHDRAQFI